MNPLLVDAFFELEVVEREAGKLAAILEQTDAASFAGDLDGWLRLQGLASVVEKIYSGYEKVMARIAASVDGNPVAHTEEWHAALVRRMAHPYPGIRPAVLSASTADLVHGLRAFRHRERNTYGSDLAADRVLENARHCTLLVVRFRDDLTVLDAHLSQDGSADRPDPHDR